MVSYSGQELTISALDLNGLGFHEGTICRHEQVLTPGMKCSSPSLVFVFLEILVVPDALHSFFLCSLRKLWS